jgi:hypothetical protein
MTLSAMMLRPIVAGLISKLSDRPAFARLS